MASSMKTSRKQTFAAGLMGIAALFAVGVVVVLLMSGAEEGSDMGVIDEHRPVVGELAPNFALVDLHDDTLVRQLSDFHGQVVVLNWYASWCGPCAREIPDFQEAQDALGDEVVFLLENLQESRERAQSFLDGLDATMISVLDRDGDVLAHYRGTGMPTTFFIDREGRISAGGSGLVTEDMLRKELAALELEY